MKKFIFCLVAFLGCFVTTKAQTVTVASVKVAPGSTASFSLSLTGGKVDKYGSLKFTATFPTDLAVTTTGNFDVNQTAWKGATGAVGDIDATGVALVGFSGSNFISTSDVNDLVSVEIAIDKDAKEGTYDVTLSDIYFGYNSSDKDKAGDVTFQVIVKNLETITLDEESETAPTASDGAVNVKVKRTIAANEWSTICLPFAMTGDQVKDAFGEDVKFAEFDSWTITDETPAANAVQSVKLTFTTVDAVANGIEANHPYMIKVGSALTEFGVSEVTILDPGADEYGMVQAITKQFKIGRTAYNLVMNAYYAKSTLLNKEFFVSGNQLWYNDADDATAIKAFRATFTFDDRLTLTFLTSGSRVTMDFVDGETNGINNTIQTGEQNNQYYNLNGLRVETPAKGIYIKNGKKVVVK